MDLSHIGTGCLYWTVPVYVRISVMQSPQQPLYMDSPKSKFNVTLIFAMVVAVIGLATGATFLLILGLIGAVMNWFTSPKQFQIYQNALVIVYGKPRVKAIPFPDISHTEILVMPMGSRLRVRLINGKRVLVAVENIEEFRARLDDAMEKFNGTYGEGVIVDQEPEDPTPY